ncbi:Ubiquitin carboxyl-terminal hydrolase 31 [Homalodisca vitripennis]|nr:Ubiquitin carboxyl-terminal hydrolase 31 [Homalodisca vitripennis]
MESQWKNSFGRPDDVVAAETLANHMRCNESFVHAVFQAQFRSSLTCPRCKRQSNTFDPFLCVSVPVPQDQYKAVIVTVLYTSQQPRQHCSPAMSFSPDQSTICLVYGHVHNGFPVFCVGFGNPSVCLLSGGRKHFINR